MWTGGRTKKRAVVPQVLRHPHFPFSLCMDGRGFVFVCSGNQCTTREKKNSDHTVMMNLAREKEKHTKAETQKQ